MRIQSIIPNAVPLLSIINAEGEPLPVVAWAVADTGRLYPLGPGTALETLRIGDTVGIDGRKDLVDLHLGRWFASPANQRAAIAADKSYKEGEPLFPEGVTFGGGAPVVQNSIPFIDVDRKTVDSFVEAGAFGVTKPRELGPKDARGAYRVVFDGPAFKKGGYFMLAGAHTNSPIAVFFVPPDHATPSGSNRSGITVSKVTRADAEKEPLKALIVPFENILDPAWQGTGHPEFADSASAAITEGGTIGRITDDGIEVVTPDGEAPEAEPAEDDDGSDLL